MLLQSLYVAINEKLCIVIATVPNARTDMSHKPALVSIADYEDHAAHWLQKMVYDYYRSGADEEHTLADNTHAFKRSVQTTREENLCCKYSL